MKCKYCNPPFKEWSGGYWEEAAWQINRYEDGQGVHYELLAIGYPPSDNHLANLPTVINYCPMCGREL